MISRQSIGLWIVCGTVAIGAMAPPKAEACRARWNRAGCCCSTACPSCATVAPIASTAATPSTEPDDAAAWLGKRVMVTSRNACLQFDANHSRVAYFGAVFPVVSVNGQWLWVGEGWLLKRDVVPADKAVDHFTEALQRSPTAEAYLDRAQAFGSLSMGNQALTDVNESLRLKRTAAGLFRRANTHNGQKDFAMAIEDVSEAITLDPHDGRFFWLRAICYWHKAEFKKALADSDEAVRQMTDKAEAHRLAAWFRATCIDEKYRDGAVAIDYARKACEESFWRDASCLDTLAAAYAEKGDYPAAVKCETTVLDFSSAEITEKERAKYMRRLALFEAGAPFHKIPEGL